MTDPDVLAAVAAALAEQFGHAPARASTSFLGVEPIEVLRFEPGPGERAYVSLGMSRRPMTPAADAVLAAAGPRAELALELHDPTDAFGGVWRSLALLAAAPAVEGVVYATGMTVDVGRQLAAGTRCTGGVVAEAAIPAIATPAGPVGVLRILPATPAELAWCRVHGSEALRDRWTAQRTDLADLARRGVRLD